MATFKTKLKNGTSNFDSAARNGFSIMTVMNVVVCKALSAEQYNKLSPYNIATATIEDGTLTITKDAEGHTLADSDGNITTEVLCKLDTLKIANLTQEGPTKTVKGGQYSNPLIKFGKTARLEMQDALGTSAAMDALCGAVEEYKEGLPSTKTITGIHVGESFESPKLLIGDSFMIDRTTGQQVNFKIIIYQFLPDSIMNLTQDAEGDATVFDMNGDVLTTNIKLHNVDGALVSFGAQYSIVDPLEDMSED